MKTLHQRRVERFMELAKQKVPGNPTLPSSDIRLFRARMVLEEALELISALGCAVNIDLEVVEAPSFSLKLDEIAKECADLSVVSIGTLSACGFEDEPVLLAVDMNNLQKFGEGSYRREDGKWIKPPGHKPPDLKGGG